MTTLPAEDQPPPRPPTPIPGSELLMYAVIGLIGVVMLAGYALSLIGGREHLVILIIGALFSGTWVMAVSGDPVHRYLDGAKR